MFKFRPFLNTDPSALVDIWCRSPPVERQVRQLTVAQCENLILAKPYFDPEGLIVAVQGTGQSETIIGFVHASFSRNHDGSDLDVTKGVVCALKVLAGPQTAEIAQGLLLKACQYLKQRGAKTVNAGSCFPYAPFYLGLYGGSEVPGVLTADGIFLAAAAACSFQPQDRVIAWHRSLSGFRPVGGREQMSIRRKYQVNALSDPTPTTWWENCTLGAAQRERFSMFNKQQQAVHGDVSFWDMHPLAGDVRTRGVFDLNVTTEHRRSGIATFLLGDALKQLMQDGIEQVEAQTCEADDVSCRVFQKNGFVGTPAGVLLSRPL